jgi:hypothetical protein
VDDGVAPDSERRQRLPPNESGCRSTAWGVAIAGAVSARVADGLEEEGFVQARLLGKALRAALLTLVSGDRLTATAIIQPPSRSPP